MDCTGLLGGPIVPELVLLTFDYVTLRTKTSFNVRFRRTTIYDGSPHDLPFVDLLFDSFPLLIANGEE